MKRKLFVICLLGLIFTIKLNLVNAKEIFYTNQYGVAFNENQYNYYSKMFWNGYQDLVTQDEFDYVNELDLFDSKIETFILQEKALQPLSTLTEKSRTLTMNKSCS